jgi:zinc protease
VLPSHAVAPIPIERYTLPNGLRVVLSRAERAPVVAINLWYDVGSKHEKAGKTGFAHLFEHMMFQGSANIEKSEHFQLINAAGGTLNATTWLDRTNFFETLPSHQLELALWLEAERMANLLPAMTQEKLDNQRDVVKNERRWSVDNTPYGDWDERLPALLYPESHPYHHSTIGSMEDLSAASLEDVEQFFATFYCPNNAVLSIVGDFEPSTAMQMVERHFGPIPANPDLPAPPDMSLEPFKLGHEVRDLVAGQVPLPRVYLGYRIPVLGTDGFDACEVAGDLLATGRASRMYAKLVRTDQLAQDVSIFPIPLIGGAAMVAVWATARPGVEPERLEAAMVHEIDLLRDEGPRSMELDRVRNLHDAGVASALERITERADRLSMYTLLLDAPERINEEMERYAVAGGAEVQAILRDYLSEDNRVVLTYVPAEAPPAAPAAGGAGEATA